MKFISTLLVLLFLSLVGISQSLKPTETEALLNINVKNESGEPGIGDEITLTGKTSGKDMRELPMKKDYSRC